GPHHVRALVLPPEVSPAVLRSGLKDDPRFERFFQSPWEIDRYLDPELGSNPAGIGYFVLLVVSALSFLCHRPALRDGRLQLWLLFAILGGWNLRLTPFFAVVAGIVLVLNVQDGMRCSAASPVAARSGRRLAGYAATVAACVVALGFAWTGWLYSAFGQPR